MLLMMANAASALTVYQCQIKERGKSGWVPKLVVLAHDLKTGDVQVSDPIILHFNDQQPLPATIALENNKRISFKWTLKGVRNRSGQYAPQFSFRGTYLKAKKEMVVTAKPLGYANTFTRQGPCTVATK